MHLRFFRSDWIDNTGFFNMRLRTRIKIKFKGRPFLSKLYDVPSKKFGFTGSIYIIYKCSVFALAVGYEKTLRICTILKNTAMIATYGIFFNRVEAYIVLQSATYPNFRSACI